MRKKTPKKICIKHTRWMDVFQTYRISSVREKKVVIEPISHNTDRHRNQVFATSKKKILQLFFLFAQILMNIEIFRPPVSVFVHKCVLCQFIFYFLVFFEHDTKTFVWTNIPSKQQLLNELFFPHSFTQNKCYSGFWILVKKKHVT